MAVVSIIVPVYNTGQYLYKCIESLKAQTLRDLEIIIVDDGSKQETADICDEQAASDSRIKVVHKANEGVSVARNTGLSMASGQYIGFVDSDDWIDPNMFETLLHEAESSNAEIVMCDSTTEWSSGKTESDTFGCYSSLCTLQKSQITTVQLLEIAGSCWRALYRTNLIDNNNIKFPVGLKFSEDRIFNIIALGCSTSFRYLKKSFYNRYIREGSCVMSYHPDFTEVTLRVNDVMNAVLKQYWDESYIPAFEQRNLRGIGYNTVCIFNEPSLSCRDKRDAIQKVFDNSKLQQLLKQYPTETKALRYIKNKNLYGLYMLSLVESLKNIIRPILKR